MSPEREESLRRFHATHIEREPDCEGCEILRAWYNERVRLHDELEQLRAWAGR